MENTQHLPGISDSITGADLAGERFRANTGRKPQELTPEQKAQRERFLRWHTTGSLG